ncbi:MAG: hypothetical protein ABSA06_05610 [Geobacteraceae bacterium]|jgi:hypothetical protein
MAAFFFTGDKEEKGSLSNENNRLNFFEAGITRREMMEPAEV